MSNPIPDHLQPSSFLTGSAQAEFEDSLKVVDITTGFWVDALHENAEDYFTQDLENY
jgi:hypothetical protein|tara:strand:+ start:366 stop:536 length:171 start_codon:yes stop_codon:yes gene_type:complete